MATQTLSFLTQGDKLGRSAALDEAVRSMVSSTFVQGRFRVVKDLRALAMAGGDLWTGGNSGRLIANDSQVSPVSRRNHGRDTFFPFVLGVGKKGVWYHGITLFPV